MTNAFGQALVIDGDLNSRHVIRTALLQSGFQCDIASDAQEAFQLLSERRYHAVVTELFLPKTNGGEFVIALRAQFKSMIVVVYTRGLEGEIYRGLKNEGVDVIFAKPTDPSVIARRIRKLVEHRFSSERNATALPSRQITEHGALSMLLQGDRWIQQSRGLNEAFRFMIVVLAGILFGMGWGNSLDPNLAGICKMFGFCGFGFYLCLQLVAHQRAQGRLKLIQLSAERRLSMHLDEENRSERYQFGATTAAAN